MKKNKFIILKRIKYSESDLILHAISQQGEKLCFIAKGALRSKKRFGGGVLEPTHNVSLSYAPKKYNNSNEGELFFLNEAVLENAFEGLRTDYSRLEMGLYFVSVVDRLSLEGSVDSDGLYNVLGHSLNELQTTGDLHLLKFHFEVKILHQQGVLPEDLQQSVLFKTAISSHAQLKEKLNTTELEVLQLKASRTVHQYLDYPASRD